MGLGSKNLRRDEEDGHQAKTFNIIQKRPNTGCRDKNWDTKTKQGEYHDSS